MRLYIYGAGRIGRPLEEMLAEKGCAIEGFIDINAANRCYKNYKIITPDQIDKEEDVWIIVALEKVNVANSVKESLENDGCPHVILYSDRRIQDNLCLRKTGKECSECVFASVCKQERFPGGEGIHLDSIGLTVTTRCTLNCKNCVMLAPMLKSNRAAKDMSVCDFEASLKALERCIDTVNVWLVSGGEPFLNKDIGTILKMILSSKIEFKMIDILTNGTFPISDEIIRLLQHQKIKVTVDNYGGKLGEREKNAIQTNIEKLKMNNCNFSVLNNEDGTWYDLGNFEDRKSSEPEMEKQFKECVWGDCINLMPEGYFGRCSRNMVWVSMSDGKCGEYIDLLNDGENCMEDKIKRMLETKALVACNFCNGSKCGNIVSAGVQEKYDKKLKMDWGGV